MKSGRKSRAELAASPVYLPPLDRLQSPADLSPPARQLFIDVVLANEPSHFRASDLPLLSAYCRAAEQERYAAERLATEGYIIERDRPSPWLAVLGQSQKALVALSHRLRLSPQGRSPTNPKRAPSVSAYDRMALENRGSMPLPLPDRRGWPGWPPPEGDKK